MVVDTGTQRGLRRFPFRAGGGNIVLTSSVRGCDHAYRPPAPLPPEKRLGPLRLILTLARDPLECWAREYFEKWFVAGGLPIGRVVVTSHPDAIRRVLMDNAANYAKDSLQRRVLSAGLGDGLLSAEGEQWRVQRRTLAPLFARRTVTGFGSAMAAAAQSLVERWRRHAGTPIDVSAEMRRVTLDVLQRTIFSDGLGRGADEFRNAMATYFSTIGKIGALDVLGAPDFVPRLSQLRVRSTLRFFENAIDDLVAARRRASRERSTDAPKDILTLLLGALDPETGGRMDEAEVKSNILTFIAAGHETTANALTWAMFLLSQSDDWRERIEQEVDQIDSTLDDEALVQTRAVIEEALRLYPPIAAISRVAMQDDELAGEPIRRGTMVVVSSYVLHRHRLLWNAPDAFDPTRFMGAARSRIDRFAYLPFGIGPRTCIGSSFALQEAVLVLAAIVRHFRFGVVPGHRVRPTLRVTLCPAGGMPMNIEPKVAD
jgi:cytochrome P450